MDCRKRERQQALQDDDSDVEMGDTSSNADSKEFGGKRIIMKGQVKQNHSEIEKRRRDKMNTYINELSSMIPMCNAMSRKLDKLTVLRMAVQHMRALRGGSKPITESNYKPSFLSDEDLKNLVLESADGFLLVVGCDRGRILYVSDSVQKILSQPQSDLVGQSFFDLVHPKDMATVKDQVSYLDNPPTDKPSDKNSPAAASKTESKQVPKQMCSGARRSFVCRLKCGSKGKKLKGNVDESSDFYIMNRKAKLKSLAANDKKKYVVVHFTGYLKSWPPSGVAMEDDEEDQDSKNLSCLIAVGREVAVADLDTKFDDQTFPTEFVSRHSIDGKFIYVDQRILPICGYLPQEMLGTSAYDYFHPQDLHKIAQTHKNTLITPDSYNVTYRFMCKAGHYIWLNSKSTNFRNPWTKELEFIICVNEIDLSKPNPIVVCNVQAGITHQRPILPAQSSNVPTADMVPADPEQSRKTVRKVIETLQEGQGPGNIKRIRPKSDGDDDPAGAAQIGSVIAELGNDSVNQHRTAHSMLGPQAPNPNMVNDLSNRQRLNPGPSTSSLTNPGESSSAVGGPMLSMFPPMNNPGMPEMSQPHLVEQLIGMQQAIESMERPGMHQNEETMAMFMNMLEADAGLGGDLNDILFESN